MTAKTVKTKMVPPDGGWGWVVLFSALVVNFLIPGTVKSFGVLFVEFLHVFKASSTAASWMPALCYFLYNSLGPLSSILSTKYSYKTVTLIGGTFAASGMMLSYFAKSVTYLYVSYGLMVGIGAGLSFSPTVYIVTAYFERLRGFANGLCISGSAIGTIVLPPLLQYLLDCFGYRGAVLIMGAITLNTLICALLYDPVEQHMIEVPIEEGIDNEALILDEPSMDINGKQASTNSSKLDKTFKETTETNNEDKTKQLKILSELLENTVSGSGTGTGKEESEEDRRRRPSTASNSSKKGIKMAEEKGKEEGRSGGNDDGTEMQRTISNTDKVFIEDEGNTVENRNTNLSRRGSKVSETNLTANKLILSECNTDKCVDNENRDDKIIEKPKLEDSKQLCIKALPESTAVKTEPIGNPPFFDLSVLRDPIYLVILISNSTSAISNTNFMILLPSYAISQGFDKHASALLLSVVSALDLVGRIGGSSLSDIDFIPKYYYFVCGLGMSGIALALLPMAKTYAMLSFFCALFGLSSGMYIGITTVILADMLGTEKLSSSYGISLFVNGVLQLVGPPICGYIYESVGSYKPIFLALGIILIMGTALWAAVPIINRNHKKKLEVV